MNLEILGEKNLQNESIFFTNSGLELKPNFLDFS